MHPALILRRRRMGGGASLADYAAGGNTPALVADFENGVYLGTISEEADVTLVGSAAMGTVGGSPRLVIPAGLSDKAVIPAAKLPVLTAGATIALWGNITHLDNGLAVEASLLHWPNTAAPVPYIRLQLATSGSYTGALKCVQYDGVNTPRTAVEAIPGTVAIGTDTPFKMAGYAGTNSTNVAVSGAARTEVTLTVAAPTLSGVDLALGFEGSACAIQRLVIWPDVSGDDAMIEEAST